MTKFNLIKIMNQYSWLFLPIFVYLLVYFLINQGSRIKLESIRQIKLLKFLEVFKRLDFNILIALILTSYFVFVKYLNHLSFQTAGFDFGIFDQNFFVQSRLIFPPANSVRTIENLWIDHQHFTQILLAPLYWFGNGFNGLVMVMLSPVLMILVPAILIYLSAQNLFKYFKLEHKTCFWLIGLISILLAIHPYTQASIEFYYHEQYLFGLFFPLSVYFLTKYLVTRLRIDLVWLVFSYIAWLGVKEDQWLYILTFIIQSSLWIFILDKLDKTKVLETWNKFKPLWIINILSVIVCGVYWKVIQAWLKVVSPSWGGYISNYDYFIKINKELIQTQNLNNYWDGLTMVREDAATYMYQHFLHFDLLGILWLPVGVLVNYSVRLFSSNGFLRHPWFHYGSQTPALAVSGIIFTYIILIKSARFSRYAKKYLAFCLGSYILGYMAVIGWSSGIDINRPNNYSLYSIPQAFISYKQTASERKSFNQIKNEIKPDFKIRTSSNYIPQLSARTDIASLISLDKPTLEENIELINNDKYNYWLIPKKTEPALINKINELKDLQISENQKTNITAIKETDQQILFKVN